jgi:hypothetical protein
MKINLDKLVLVILVVTLFDMVTFAIAQKPKEIDELDLLIAKSKKSMSKAGTVVQAAAKAQEETLTAVVSHIEEVEHEAEVAQQKVEMFSVRMIENGIDTSAVVEEQKMEYIPEIKDAYDVYVKGGGDLDIESFLMYIYYKQK